jgi:hypothetical protein
VLKNISDYNDALQKANTSVLKGIISDESIFGFNWASGGTRTESQDIKSAAGNYLIPDIGLVNIFSVIKGPLAHDYQFKNIVRPYWGLNISWVPINKNVSIKSVKYYKVLHYFSTTIGLTAIPLNLSGGADLIKSMSLVTGIGIRPFRWGRVTIGSLMYTRDNPNPAKSPIITFAPLLGVSVDLDVVSWAQILQGKIF